MRPAKRNKPLDRTDFGGMTRAQIHADSDAAQDRQTVLLRMNVTWLEQAAQLVAELDDRMFTAVPNGLDPHRAGSHLRHVLEFYECFLGGLDSLYIDYDARRRDLDLERSRVAALKRIASLIERLSMDPRLRTDGVLFVRMEDAPEDLEDAHLMTSIGRELLALSSHTIHHFALIGMTLRALEVAVPTDFGVAPSTLRHRQRKEAA